MGRWCESSKNDQFQEEEIVLRTLVGTETNAELCLAALGAVAIHSRKFSAENWVIQRLFGFLDGYLQPLFNQHTSRVLNLRRWYSARILSARFALRAQTGEPVDDLLARAHEILDVRENSLPTEEGLLRRYLAQLNEALSVAQSHHVTDTINSVERLLFSLSNGIHYHPAP